MAEIKSTLDLIMERTKDLTLTAEEKKTIQTKEIKDRMRGWLQRYRDGSVTGTEIKEYLELEGSSSPEAAALLRDECLAQVNPEEDNGKIFSLLQTVLAMDTGPLERLVTDFHEARQRLLTIAAGEALAFLHSRGICGDAVVPNPSLSPGWHRGLEAARQNFQESLRRLKQGKQKTKIEKAK